MIFEVKKTLSRRTFPKVQRLEPLVIQTFSLDFALNCNIAKYVWFLQSWCSQNIIVEKILEELSMLDTIIEVIWT
jgi:hypothetical protein